jgi:hypothetical protein
VQKAESWRGDDLSLCVEENKLIFSGSSRRDSQESLEKYFIKYFIEPVRSKIPQI